ncbi:MmyB family transcriptional regulator [Azospirillum rugosum]|uniref:MmyB family transcriptional regulator n=1 Tax=Azospirillum rugosum TaxID=416170 RepID=UPI0031B8A7DA
MTSGPAIAGCIRCRTGRRREGDRQPRRRAVPGEGIKHLQHPELGTFELECSAFAVDGRPDLSLLVYNPLDERIEDRIRTLAPRTID